MTTLAGKTVVVTGVSKGIGAAVAAAMVAAGARVIGHYGRDRAGAETAVAGAADGQATLISADFHDMAAVDAFWDDCRAAAGGRIDTLVNNAGIMRQTGGIPDPIEDWDAVWSETMTVNVHAPARLLRHAVRDWLDAGKGGSIIGIGSWAATRGTSNPRAIAYAASKAAITAATKTVARNYADRGILAYVIAPGVVRTQMSVDSAEAVGGEAAVTAGLPMGEWVPPEDIGALCAFLAEGRARHLTGSTIDLNGAAYIR
ncbi:SDR family NAD(P)-dependent oxidoreductase [Jannaschia seohaensis]|uniref:NAD(P)-dependent dehydrogenase (Short-subunit alcohol dehydrogenase family) n=1 Tax=Jannaschia seohaensis TaxID=475081 RepID=A0A2Y9AYM0_9RHOB|nr:SDR family oxidoreductase [Jannaschia seohaensis]PWJ17041.1 NAD(P)-dependent dehydrogenase (short-subunit alcohol dehydrogenase family) [Jannaschia seohaensis]SSA48378.1 NAD(P)-dependent dehydrogenase, short-chain alcohol dehydrogenase family [Jannaschia seohaensis]